MITSIETFSESSAERIFFRQNICNKPFKNLHISRNSRCIIGSELWNGIKNDWNSCETKAANAIYPSVFLSFNESLIYWYWSVGKMFCLNESSFGNLTRKYSFKFSYCSRVQRHTYFMVIHLVGTWDIFSVLCNYICNRLQRSLTFTSSTCSS